MYFFKLYTIAVDLIQVKSVKINFTEDKGKKRFTSCLF